MIKSEYTFPSGDGKTPLHAVVWQPEGPVAAVVQIAHGVSEYVGRYDSTARWLTDRGIAVVGNDHIGHGQSLAPGAAPLYFGGRGSWETVVDDLRTLRVREGQRFPGAPYFLMGFSMGSFLTRSYLIRYPGDVSGAIVVGTGQMSLPAIAYCRLIALRENRRVGAERTSDVVNQLSFDKYNRIFSPTRTEYDWLSADPKNVDAYIADPLCGGSASVGLCREMLRAMRDLQRPRELGKMDPGLPVLFAAGEQDPVGDCGQGARRAYESFRRAGVRDVTLRLYPGARHEIFNDLCQEQVRADLLAWLRDRLPPAYAARLTSPAAAPDAVPPDRG
jgi:alpha-beta hydrolase superfamily lysophospholipase